MYKEKLTELRTRLDDVDGRLLDLVGERLQIAREVAKVKQESPLDVLDSRREEIILERLATLALEREIDPFFVKRLFSLLIEGSRSIQESLITGLGGSELRLAYQGAPGSYSWIAAEKFFGERVKELDSRGVNTFHEAAERVVSGEADCALLPLENTIAGSINEVYDLFAGNELFMVGEEILPIEHVLLGLPGTKYEDIRVILGHPVALQQCARYLNGIEGPRVESHVDGAEAARLIAEEKWSDHAVIAPEEAGVLYGLQVLRRDIADSLRNFTRFAVIARSPRHVDGRFPAKTSVMLELSHQTGALAGILNLLQVKGVNLTKLESRPQVQNPWLYRFYLDFEGNVESREIREALDEIRAMTVTLRVIGCYVDRSRLKTV